MGGFDASLKVAGDTRPIAARLVIDQGRLLVTSGNQTIGEWPVGDLDFQRTSQGFRVNIDGEDVTLEMADPLSFETAIGLKTSRKTKKPKKARPDFDRLHRILVATLSGVDGMLARVEKAYGSLLPQWVFTRRTVGLLVASILVMLIFPGVVSVILLALGFITVVFGALVYTDNSLAARVLPGRATAIHVLVAGVGIVVLGFLLGIIAS